VQACKEVHGFDVVVPAGDRGGQIGREWRKERGLRGEEEGYVLDLGGGLRGGEGWETGELLLHLRRRHPHPTHTMCGPTRYQSLSTTQNAESHSPIPHDTRKHIPLRHLPLRPP
jgi:hypothetical protein